MLPRGKHIKWREAVRPKTDQESHDIMYTFIRLGSSHFRPPLLMAQCARHIRCNSLVVTMVEEEGKGGRRQTSKCVGGIHGVEAVAKLDDEE